MSWKEHEESGVRTILYKRLESHSKTGIICLDDSEPRWTSEETIDLTVSHSGFIYSWSGNAVIFSYLPVFHRNLPL